MTGSDNPLLLIGTGKQDFRVTCSPPSLPATRVHLFSGAEPGRARAAVLSDQLIQLLPLTEEIPTRSAPGSPTKS
jgi:hypothetical protein